MGTAASSMTAEELRAYQLEAGPKQRQESSGEKKSVDERNSSPSIVARIDTSDLSDNKQSRGPSKKEEPAGQLDIHHERYAPSKSGDRKGVDHHPDTEGSDTIYSDKFLGVEQEKQTIRLIKRTSFLNKGQYPRYPQDKDITVDVSDIDLERAFVIYISHCWVRGYAGTPGYDGMARPDTTEDDCYALCAEGIDKARDAWAPGVDTYLWLDYGCLDQDRNPAVQLSQVPS